MTQYHITGLDLEAMALVVSCPRCKAQPGQPCELKVRRGWSYHVGRIDKAERQRRKDLYGCRRCEYACDCSPRAARWLPVMTVVACQTPERIRP
jgi:hypothetical protein